ncbi:MAG: RDD family protein [Patescibacteria group bacterium]
MAIGAKVYAENGEKLTLGKIVLRETVGKLISSVIFYIGYIIAGFTSKKQSLHDIMAHSVVVYDEKGPNKMGVGITWGCYTFLILGFMIFFGILISLGMWVSTIENEIIDYEEYYEGLEADMNEIELQESNTVQGIEILDMQGSEDVIELQELGGAGVSVE